jgi:SNF2 family DNA or RNA helicase
MFNLTDKKIMMKCHSPEVYERGIKYYEAGRITDIEIDESLGFVEAVVSGSEDYLVNLEFSGSGEILSADCDCPAFSEYGNCCKHMIAVLVYLKNTELRPQRPWEMEVEESTPDVSGEVIGFFEDRLHLSSKEPVDVEITLEVERWGLHGRDIRTAVSMRMGTKKLYVVKSVKGLIESLQQNSPLVFGKGFTFDPARSRFKEEDLPIMEFFRDMCDMDAIVQYNCVYNSGSLFKGKYLYLSHLSVGRFLDLIGTRHFRAVVLGREYKDVGIVNEDLPVDFMLKKSGRSLVLDVNILPGLIPLTPDGKFMFLNGTVYCISDSQRENLAPFYKVLAEKGNRSIVFSTKDGERFASFVLPNIKKAGRLTMEKGMEDLFCHTPLDAKIYLDRDGMRIIAVFSFCYGEYTINPFDPAPELRGDNIIIRDFERERKIMAVFENCFFKVNRGEVYLDDDDRIYDFVINHIPRLQELCEIYYSDSFKKIRICNSSYVRSTVRLNDDEDLLEFSFSIDGIDRENLAGIFASIKSQKRYHRLNDGSFLPLDSGNLKSMANIIEYMDIEDEEIGRDAINLPRFRAAYLDEKLKEFESIQVERNLAFRSLVDNIKRPRDMEFGVPGELQDIMRPYQVTGFKWLKTLAAYGFGGILADDMGLGKTLQAIAFLLSEREKISLPSLVICPTSLIYNWESEIQKFAPSLKVLIISGSREEREHMVKQIGEADVVVTSYPLMRRDIEYYRDISFGYCILDEAQHIKNPDSVNARSAKEIKARGYFALTGTPIENNLTELWSIFDFVMPGYLLSHGRFTERFEKPILSGDNEGAFKELGRHVGPFILRRLKKDVLKELPPKIESVLTAELTMEQKRVYLAYLEQIKGRIEEDIRDKGFEKSRIQILAGLTRLRQICCHPSLFIENYNGESGKMELLLELLEELKEGGHRVLLFSQFTGALKLIKGHLEMRNISYFYLDGSTKADCRTDMVKAFNQGFRDTFLISLKAGGTGLNLTGADTVIHFDLWWNPAVEEQATDRAHRIGQQSAVQVMKLITRGTIEEKIFKLQQKKRELINSVLQPGETFISRMTEEDIRDLFRIS